MEYYAGHVGFYVIYVETWSPCPFESKSVRERCRSCFFPFRKTGSPESGSERREERDCIPSARNPSGFCHPISCMSSQRGTSPARPPRHCPGKQTIMDSKREGREGRNGWSHFPMSRHSPVKSNIPNLAFASETTNMTLKWH